jgi:hypothetical protein
VIGVVNKTTTSKLAASEIRRLAMIDLVDSRIE